jgi:phage shock protein PspC (stress-responsive transcriptional regulator)
MKTAITVDLGGASYSLDQDAFLALHAYLDRAAERLGEHPDRDEVLAGLERSIGAKLASEGVRSAPFSGAEMAAVLKGVGKVDGPRLGPARDADTEPGLGNGEPGRSFGDDGLELGSRDDDAWARPRRLYRLEDGRRIAGVCSGLAAYFNLDVTLVRALMIIGAFFSGGVVFVVYIALMFAMPVARTSTEIAAAHGALRSA